MRVMFVFQRQSSYYSPWVRLIRLSSYRGCICGQDACRYFRASLHSPWHTCAAFCAIDLLQTSRHMMCTKCSAKGEITSPHLSIVMRRSYRQCWRPVRALSRLTENNLFLTRIWLTRLDSQSHRKRGLRTHPYSRYGFNSSRSADISRPNVRRETRPMVVTTVPILEGPSQTMGNTRTGPQRVAQVTVMPCFVWCR